MSGFPIIDLIAGIIFIYFLLSIISSSLVEIFMSSFKIRSKFLEKWLLTIFDQKVIQPNGSTPKLGRAIMDHSLTTALSKSGKATSFMDAKNFVSSLLEKVTFKPDKPTEVATDIDQVIAAITDAKSVNGLPLLPTDLQRAFLMFAADAKATYTAATVNKVDGVPIVSAMQLFREKLENWFDTSMDRIQGKMKTKYTRPVTLFVGIAVVIALNADTIAIAKYLYNSPEARAKFAQQAYQTAKDTAVQKRIDSLSAHVETQDIAAALKDNQKQLKDGIATLKESGIPLGWNDDNSKISASKVAGWLASILAIMLGAPFWFDLLNKIGNLRGSGPKPESSTDKDKKDK